jgi:hypothetical protein
MCAHCRAGTDPQTVEAETRAFAAWLRLGRNGEPPPHENYKAYWNETTQGEPFSVEAAVRACEKCLELLS